MSQATKTAIWPHFFVIAHNINQPVYSSYDNNYFPPRILFLSFREVIFRCLMPTPIVIIWTCQEPELLRDRERNLDLHLFFFGFLLASFRYTCRYFSSALHACKHVVNLRPCRAINFQGNDKYRYISWCGGKIVSIAEMILLPADTYLCHVFNLSSLCLQVVSSLSPICLSH